MASKNSSGEQSEAGLAKGIGKLGGIGSTAPVDFIQSWFDMNATSAELPSKAVRAFQVIRIPHIVGVE